MSLTLERYVFAESAKSFAMALVVLTLVFVGAGGLRLAQDLHGLELSLLFRMLATVLAASLKVSLPIAVLAGCTLTFGRLAHDHEVAAIRSVGVHLHRIVSPVIAMGVLVAIFAFVLGHTVVPDALARARHLLFECVGQAAAFATSKDSRSIPDLPGIRLHYRGIDDEGALVDLVLHRIDRDEGLSEEIVARRGWIRFVHGRIELVLERGSIAFIRSVPKVHDVDGWKRPGKSDVLTDWRKASGSGALDESWFDLELRYQDRRTWWMGFERYELFLDPDQVGATSVSLGPSCLRFAALRVQIEGLVTLLEGFERELAEWTGEFTRLEHLVGALENGDPALVASLRNEATALLARAAEQEDRAAHEADGNRRTALEGLARRLRERSQRKCLLAGRIEQRDAIYAAVLRQRLRILQPCILAKRASILACADHVRACHIEIHKRGSLPLACVVVVLVGAPLGIGLRHSNRLVALGVSAVPVLGIYYPLMLVGEHLAIAERLTPATAMHLPNAVLGSMGLLALWRVYRR